MDKCDNNQNDGNKTIEIEVEDRIISNVENYDLEIIQKIVAGMFKKYKEDLPNKKRQNENFADEQKEIISKFEKVIRCIRYQVVDMKEFYKNFDDNLELLVEISEVSSIRQALNNLLEEYLKIYKIEILKIKCIGKKNDSSKEEKISKYFNSKKIEIDFKGELIDNENS
ncbi:hypothetical protein psyc5s11_33840 [Clostridium gelidum]|uniref:Uncharacterized protein n=1 Tax=Clostridium gelidum TaxID=704125 RepID=A0ABN6IZ00_9CLOT|nr:hypothetical protein [Clostridium gelidum]BCZ47317.1 hypothetical protein psyc5s11_33840 [Clostridium gelidum]